MKKGWKRLEKQMPPILLARLVAETSTAHGSLDGLDPVTALEVVPPASGLKAELVDDELLVTPAEAP